jgi:hypothetical protein
MDFLGGALPNVMFIVGMLAIGLGLGIELKLVPLNKEIDKTGRIGAIVVGGVLVVASLYIYLNPGLANRSQPTPSVASAALIPAAGAPAGSTAAAAPAPTSAPPAPATAAPAPTAAPEATATPAPTAAPAPTAVPPTAIPAVQVPDLHGQNEEEAKNTLQKAGLQSRKVDRCAGTDKGAPKAKKREIQCQNPAAGSQAPLGTVVEYVVAH